MKRSVTIVMGIGLLLASATPMAAEPLSDEEATHRHVLELGGQVAEKTGTATGPNPYLAFLQDPAAVDYASWRKRTQQQARLRSTLQAAAGEAQLDAAWNSSAPPLVRREREAPSRIGANDEVASSERIRGYGTRPNLNNRAVVTGTLAQLEEPEVTRLPRGAEDNGSRQLATGSRIGVTGAITTAGRIGDGPHGRQGTGTGDFDFYRVRVPAGHTLTARTRTPVGSLDSMLVIYDGRGEVAFNDDARGLDSEVSHVARTERTYWVMVTGFSSLPRNPNNSASGTGAESQGRYLLDITVKRVDVDTFGVWMRRGDVLGVSSWNGAEAVSVLEPDGAVVMGSSQNLSSIRPVQSPLPAGGDIVAEHVADQAGLHHVQVTGAGRYRLRVESYRSPLEGDPPIQTVFLDFDGERVNVKAIWGGPGVVSLSPFVDFIENWGLDVDTEDALIDVVTATVEENIRRDLRARGNNPQFRIRVTNSRDHADTFGDDHVSRVVVGGTIEESGISTIGIAQSIDPGNFRAEETALVLLDVLSGDPNDFGEASLNAHIRPRSDVVEFVGTAIANVVSHEAGHFFGNWHVDQFNDRPDLMDQGGNFSVMFGVGADGIGGTADDPDVDFGEDEFHPGEGFSGAEDTLTRLSQVLVR